MQKIFLFIIPIALLITGCGLNLSFPNPATPTLFIITSTLPPTLPPPSTDTLVPSTRVLTSAPYKATTTSQVNVRSDPSTAGKLLGMIGPGTKVEIIGKDPSNNWVQIIFSQSSDGKGWVTLQYINVKDPGSIPVIGIAIDSAPGPTGVIIQQVNVRSGPGTDFKTVGILNAKDVVALTGKDATNIWLQIQFSGGPDGRGWVTAAYLQTSGLESLPIVGQTSKVQGTNIPTSIPTGITSTVVAAPQDNDSPKSPSVAVIFSPGGTRSLIYSSDVSAPNGDPEDWIQFTPYSNAVIASLSCDGNGSLRVELWQNGAPLQNWGGLTCDETNQVSLSSRQPYLLHLIAVPQGNDLVNVHYIISIDTVP